MNNLDIIKLNGDKFGGDLMNTGGVIEFLKNKIMDIIRNENIDTLSQIELTKNLKDIELRATIVEKMFNQPPQEDRLNPSPIVVTYNGPTERDFAFANGEYVNTGWKPNQVIQSECFDENGISIKGQKPSAGNCRILARNGLLYDEIYESDFAKKARQKAHNKEDEVREAYKDSYKMKNTGRVIAYRRMINENDQGTVRVGEDVTINPSFSISIGNVDEVNFNFKDIALAFNQKIADIIGYDNLIADRDLVESIKILGRLGVLGDLLYKGPFLINAILSPGEGNSEIKIANKAFVGSTGYPLWLLQEQARKGGYLDLLYADKEKENAKEMLKKLPKILYYNEKFGMIRKDGTIIDVAWDTYYNEVGGIPGSIRIGSVVKELY